MTTTTYFPEPNASLVPKELSIDEVTRFKNYSFKKVHYDPVTFKLKVSTFIQRPFMDKKNNAIRWGRPKYHYSTIYFWRYGQLHKTEVRPGRDKPFFFIRRSRSAQSQIESFKHYVDTVFQYFPDQATKSLAEKIKKDTEDLGLSWIEDSIVNADFKSSILMGLYYKGLIHPEKISSNWAQHLINTQYRFKNGKVSALADIPAYLKLPTSEQEVLEKYFKFGKRRVANKKVNAVLSEWLGQSKKFTDTNITKSDFYFYLLKFFGSAARFLTIEKLIEELEYFNTLLWVNPSIDYVDILIDVRDYFIPHTKRLSTKEYRQDIPVQPMLLALKNSLEEC